MKFFSIFSRGDREADESYCDKESEVHYDYIEGDEIGDEFDSSADRDDEIIILDRFHKKAVNYRWDDYGNPAEHGPRQSNGEL
jgi:hypothetical protein